MDKRILFLVLHRENRSPGQRYRFEQYLDYLEKNGFRYTLSPLIKTQWEDQSFYDGNIVLKTYVGVISLVRRIRDLISLNDYEIVFIFRDAFFFGTFIERFISKRKIKMIYDFDDAIWLLDKNPNQGIFNKLKNPSKTNTIIGLVDSVIAGNEYLANYALKLNKNVQIIPSTIDFNEYSPVKKNKNQVCIGWTGSFSTIKHFEMIIPVLERIKWKYQNLVYFKLIGDSSYRYPELQIKGIEWRANTEVKDLSELDVGIMPLPDNPWTRGKCGMKGLQYMALEIPTIMSPVGVNKKIIQDGLNGFLAITEDEWFDKLSQLIESKELREKLGKAGRETVEDKYSVKANAHKYLDALNNMLNQ
jgi:glycosyltransferase involved in cell wall biosynthesis